MIMLISVKHLPAQTSNDILQDPRTSCKINSSQVNVYKGVDQWKKHKGQARSGYLLFIASVEPNTNFPSWLISRFNAPPVLINNLPKHCIYKPINIKYMLVISTCIVDEDHLKEKCIEFQIPVQATMSHHHAWPISNPPVWLC